MEGEPDTEGRRGCDSVLMQVDQYAINMHARCYHYAAHMLALCSSRALNMQSMPSIMP